MQLPSLIQLHGAFTHFPIAFLLFAVAIDIAAYTQSAHPEKQRIWRQFSLTLLGAAFVCALPSLLTGYIFGRNLLQPPLEYQAHWIAAVLATIISGAIFIWRYCSRDQLTSPLRAVSVAVTLLGAIAIGWTGHLGGQMVFGDDTPTSTTQLVPISTTGNDDAKLIAEGKNFYFDSEIGCSNCHKLAGQGGRGGPPLDGVGTRLPDVDWHIAHIANPKSKVPDSRMPTYDDLNQQKLRAIAHYLASLK